MVSRTPWGDFPDAVLCNDNEYTVRAHPAYRAAKAGDVDAAFQLVTHFLDDSYIQRIFNQITGDEVPIVAAVHAEEEFGRNQIAAVLAGAIGDRLNLRVDQSVVQSNIVNHTKATGWAKLARQAEFKGPVREKTSYLLVDDFIGQGGTLANFRGHFSRRGARVLGACVLTGKPYSVKLTVSSTNLNALFAKHGSYIELFCQENFGFGAHCLTESEARWLAKAESIDAIRIAITSAG